MLKVKLDLYLLQIKSYRKSHVIGQMVAENVLKDSADHTQLTGRVT